LPESGIKKLFNETNLVENFDERNVTTDWAVNAKRVIVLDKIRNNYNVKPRRAESKCIANGTSAFFYFELKQMRNGIHETSNDRLKIRSDIRRASYDNLTIILIVVVP
jgi:hypothetical protein